MTPNFNPILERNSLNVFYMDFSSIFYILLSFYINEKSTIFLYGLFNAYILDLEHISMSKSLHQIFKKNILNVL